jgi:hypothetical protein
VVSLGDVSGKGNLALLVDALKVPQLVNSPNSPRPDATLTDR